MKLFKKAVLVFLVFQIYLFSGTVISNTLSDAYYKAMVDPHGFDSYIIANLALDLDYLDNFENCFQLTIPYLDELEKQYRQEYSSCYTNTVCQEISKNIQTIMDIRKNVIGIEKFIQAKWKNSELRFLNSQFGKDCLMLFDFHRQMNFDIHKNPEFNRQIAVLSYISCQ